MKSNSTLLRLVAMGLLVAPLTAQSFEASNGCSDTGENPCIRTGSCRIQLTDWQQEVVIDRDDLYDQIGWTGL